jgi:hypothetical protein
LFGFAGEFWQRLKEKEPRAVFRFLVLERMLSKAARIFLFVKNYAKCNNRGPKKTNL